MEAAERRRAAVASRPGRTPAQFRVVLLALSAVLIRMAEGGREEYPHLTAEGTRDAVLRPVIL